MQVRHSVDALLKCADLVTEIDTLAKGFSSKPELSETPAYRSLSIGQLQSLGYLKAMPMHGTILLIGKPPATIASRPKAKGYEVAITGPMRQRLRLEATPTSFGGNRWWFVCAGVPGSHCGRRVLKVYRRQGQDFFACRDCHRASGDHGWRSARDRTINIVQLQPASISPVYPGARSA